MVPQYRPAAAGLPREVLRALELQSIGNAADAEACLRDALGKHPRDARVRYILGGMLFQDKRLDEAEEILRESVKVQPSHAESWNALGAVLVALERSGEALPCFERAVKIWPDCVEARTGIGQAMSRLEKWPEAERAFVAALKIRPDFQLARHGLASALYELQRHRESLAITEDILRHSPHDMKAQRLAKQAFDALLDFTGAEVLFKDIVGRCPQSGSAWFFLSSILSDLKKLDEAVVASGKVMELWPDSGPAHLALGRSLLEKGEFAQADEHIKKCLEAAPDDFNELEALLDAFNDIQCPAALEPLCRRMLQLDPTALWAKFRLIIALELLGRGQEAAPLRKQAAQTMKPEYIFLICTAIMNQSESAQANLEHARAYAGGVLSENARKLAAGHKFKNRGQSGGRLRIGFVSHEVRNHSVASFLEPVLARLNKEEFEVFLYSSTPVVDEVSKRLIADADRFADISALTSLERAKLIRKDALDIAIDTTGYTSGCHIETFAHRTAPVQAHYIGYFGTSGLEGMDYFLGDQRLNLPENDRFYSEKIMRLPCFWTAWQEKFKAPDIQWTPSTGIVTLGSSNALYKLGPQCLDLWGEIMLRLPGSRLLLKHRQCSDPALRAHITKTLEQKGVVPERIEFMLAKSGWHEHMAVYDRIDLCLDPMPFNGCTTAFEALWMGVPMISLEGSWMGGRVGMAMLEALGHPEWAAATEEEYVAKAVALAEDVDLRRSLRAAQREKMRASPLCDYDGVARALEDAFKQMLA